MFTEIGFLYDINLVVKKIILIDLHDKVTMLNPLMFLQGVLGGLSLDLNHLIA